MAQNIPTLFVDEYKQRIELALQHNGSVYRSAVSERPASGEQSVEVDLVGMVPMKPITQRLQPIVNDDFRTDRVWMRPSDAYAAPIIDTLDKLRLGASDARRVDLEAHDLDVGARPAQPRLEFEGRHAARAVAQIDHERVVCATQHGVPRDPPIDAAQAVRVRRAAGDLADDARRGTAPGSGRFFRRHIPSVPAPSSVG